MRLVLADDATLLRESLARALAASGFDVVAQVDAPLALLEAVERERPDVAIVDIRMPPTYSDEGLVAAASIRERYPEVGVLVLSQFVETDYAMQLVEENAEGVGYLLKDRVTELRILEDAIERVGRGETVMDHEIVRRLVARPRERSAVQSLTERELAVLELMAEGRSNRSIAAALVVSERTVETHVGHIFEKLDIVATGDEHRRVLAVLTYLRS
ncbi:MAG: response regulator transcription factor [Actinobacteria bacterium]|nr:response regulator transcription factor [Actinomycetota bacterium]